MTLACCQSQRQQAQAGFTLIEILVTLVIMGLLLALVAPSIDAFVPKARLDSAAKTIAAEVDLARSEARIQSKQYVLEFDLKKARWRRILPAEMQLTTDQELWTLEPQTEDWMALPEDVVFSGAGNANDGIARDGIYRMVFDENGFTGDHVIVLKLETDPTMVWSVQIRGISGKSEILSDFEGREHALDEVGEGAF